MPSRFFRQFTPFVRLARSGTKTLRVRLMVWNAALVLVTALACFLAVREGLRRALLNEMDEVLKADLQEVGLEVASLRATAADLRAAAALKDGSGAAELLAALNRKESVHQHNGWFVELLDADNRRLWASDLTPALSLPAKGRLVNVPTSLEGFRIVERRQPAPPRRPLRIRVGAPIDFIERDVENIDSLAAWGVIPLLIAAPLAGYWLAGRAIRPVAEIIQTTGRLRPNRMEERLPIRETGDELDRLSQTVNQFLDRIAAYLSQSNDLLANSAHELRTPLAAIRSSVEVALGGSRTPQEYQELLSEVIDECGSLERLVNQLLLLAETDSERLRARSEVIDLSVLVGRCVEMFSAAAEARQIELHAAIEPRVELAGFGHHLRQVVNNLLDNALKFTPPGGRVDVRLTRAASEEGAVVLTVSDTGCGIPAADLPHVFERFFRGDKSRQRLNETTGTGLGLSICQAIVGSHGGRICVESREGFGTTMTVSLPASRVADVANPPHDLHASPDGAAAPALGATSSRL